MFIYFYMRKEEKKLNRTGMCGEFRNQATMKKIYVHCYVTSVYKVKYHEYKDAHTYICTCTYKYTYTKPTTRITIGKGRDGKKRIQESRQ